MPGVKACVKKRQSPKGTWKVHRVARRPGDVHSAIAATCRLARWVSRWLFFWKSLHTLAVVCLSCPLFPGQVQGFFTCSKAAVYGGWLVVSSHVLANVGASSPCIAGFVFLQPWVDSERVIAGCLRASQGFAVLKVQTHDLRHSGVAWNYWRVAALHGFAKLGLGQLDVTRSCSSVHDLRCHDNNGSTIFMMGAVAVTNRQMQ
jgi:hypothetical protein